MLRTMGKFGVFILVFLLLLPLAGCQQKNEEPEEPPKIEKVTDAPVEITDLKAEEAIMYNEGYIYYKNVTDKLIDRVEFEMLLFNRDGQAIKDTHSKSSCKRVISESRLLPNTVTDRGWYIQKGTAKIKARVAKVVFSDGTTWEDPEIIQWIEREATQY
ncbi:MAG: hypothetical protein GX295_11960 [Syntrophomonadaceae bacterium]|nr:hypothetical protein [Syntrophomonadaceae bacterium]